MSGEEKSTTILLVPEFQTRRRQINYNSRTYWKLPEKDSDFKMADFYNFACEIYANYKEDDSKGNNTLRIAQNGGGSAKKEEKEEKE